MYQRYSVEYPLFLSKKFIHIGISQVYTEKQKRNNLRSINGLTSFPSLTPHKIAHDPPLAHGPPLLSICPQSVSAARCLPACLASIPIPNPSGTAAVAPAHAGRGRGRGAGRAGAEWRSRAPPAPLPASLLRFCLARRAAAVEPARRSATP